MSGYDDYLNGLADEQNKKQQLVSSVTQAANTNPDEFASMVKLSKASSISVDAIPEFKEQAQQAKVLGDIGIERLYKDNPGVTQWLSNPDNAKLAHDDTANLSSTEKAFRWFKEIPEDAMKGWEAGRLTTELGMLGNRVQEGRGDKAVWERIGEIRKREKELKGTGGFTEATTKILGQMSSTLPDAIAYGEATAIAGGGAALLAGQLGPQVALPEEIFTVPAASIGGFFAGMTAKMAEQTYRIESGANYLDMLEQGVDKDVAKYVSTGVGLVNAALETVGVKFVSDPIKKALTRQVTEKVAESMTKPTINMAVTEFAKGYGKAWGAEVGTEVMQEISAIAGEEIGKAFTSDELKSKLTSEEGRLEIAERLSGIFEEVGKGMAVLALPGASINFHGDYKRAMEAKRQTQFFENLDANAETSKLRERDKDAYMNFIQQQAGVNKVENIYVDGAVFAQSMKQAGIAPEQLDAAMPGLAKQLEEAVATGGDVVIPTGNYAANIAGTDFGKTLMQHARATEDAMSAAELVEFDKQRKDYIKAAAEAVLQENQTNDEFIKSAKEVETTMFDQLKATGRYTDQVARTNAQFVRDFVVTQAADAKMLPADFYGKYMYKVESEGQAALAQATQALSQTPEFQQWFGNSVLKNEAGNPMVLYHGTSDNVESFDLNHPNRKDTGWLGTGVYLTDSTDMAVGYANQKARAIGPRGQNVMPLYAALENPYIATDEDKARLKAGGREAADAFAKELQDQGYDGVIYQAAPDAREIVVFDPAKVKSVFNEGSWSPETSNILKQALSSRLPTAVKATEDPLGETLSINFDVTMSDPVTLGKNMVALMKTPNMRKLTGKGAKDPKRQAEEFIEHVVNNLLWLHDHMPAEMRERAELWYDGGRKTADVWADRYGISQMQGAAAIAVLSPQNGWFANVSQAERIMDMVFGLRDFAWDDAMTAEAERISKEGGLDDRMQAAIGKTLGELLNNPDVAARWIRVYDQTYNNRAYRVLTPEGGAADYVKTNKGADATMMWKSYSTISKAVSILTDGRAENIYYQLGREHKVRNFYNNLFEPNSPLGFTTIDTHAVAAALLRPLAASDTEVLQAFGGAGSASSSFTGLNGTYPIYLEAYKRAAEQRGILPRQMQSITWEAVRGLFEAAKKSGLKKGADEIWGRYKAGKIDQAQAQQEILALAGDITPPSWTEVPFNDTVSRTYEGPAQKIIDEQGNRGAVASDEAPRVFFEVAPDPNDAALTEQWNALQEADKARISQSVAEKIVPKILAELGTDGMFSMQLGGYLGATNPSMTLSVDRQELALTAAKLLGYALSQDSMMVVSEQQGVGMEPVGAISIDLPDGYGQKEVTALYDRLWELERDGNKLVGGHTTSDGHMVILNYSGLDNNELALIIDQHLGGEFTVRAGQAFAAFPNKEDYNYASDNESTVARRAPAETRANSLRAEATELLRSELGSGVFRQAGRSGAAGIQGRGSDNQGVGARYGTPIANAVSAIGYHFSRQPRGTLDSRFYGTGLAGGEGARIAQTEDGRLQNRIHFYIDTGAGIKPEAGVGSYAHAINLDNLYDISADPLNIRRTIAALGTDPDNLWFNAVESAIIDAGFDGYVARNAQGTQGVAVLLGQHTIAPDQIAAPEPAQTAPRTQARGTPVFKKYFEQPARGGFDPSRLTTILNEQADYSTFLHETAHFFLTVYSDMAAQPEASARVKADMQSLLDWFGVKDLETWNAMSLEEQRKYHEQFAYNYEIYLFEGKAPSVKMQSLFDRFSAWLRRVYKSIREDLNAVYKQEHGTDLPILTGEVREVMDRMLASDEQVKQAEQVRRMAPMFQSQEQAGMDDGAWAAYQEMVKEAQTESINDLTKASLRQMKWLENARSRVIRDIQRTTRETRKKVMAEVTEEVNNLPMFKAQEALKAAENEAEQAAVIDAFGFSSVEELKLVLKNSKNKREIIRERTDKRMLEQYGEMFDPASIEIAVERALHNEARARFVAVELRHLAKAMQPVRVMLEAARQAARSIISSKPVGSIREKDFSASEARSARQAMEALRRGDSEGAIKAKQSQLLNNQLTAEALSAKAEVAKAMELFKKVFRKDEKLAKGRDMNLVSAARAILANYGLGNTDMGAAYYLEKVKAYDPEFYAEIEPMITAHKQAGKPVTDLTMDEFRDLAEQVEALWIMSRNSKTVEIDGKRMDREDVVNELVAAIPTTGKPRLGYDKAMSDWDKRKIMLMGARAALRRVESWVDAMDNGKMDGPFRKYIWTPISEAVAKYRLAKVDYLKKYLDIVKTVEKGLTGEPIVAPEIGYTFKNKAELLHAIIHTGNNSNKRKLLLGREWASVDENDNMDTSQWDSFIARMVTEGKLTKADYDFAQEVWDLLEEMKPAAQKAHKEMYGFYFAEITADRFDTPFGSYRGGYAPAVTDPWINTEASVRNEQETQQTDNSYMFPTTGRGFTKGRVEYNKPLILDLGFLPSHLDKVLRFTFIEPRVKDVAKIVKTNKVFASAMDQLDPTIRGDMLVPWLQRTAQQMIQMPMKGMGGKLAHKFFSEVRTRTGMQMMVANFTNAIQQITGISIAGLKVKPSHLRDATWLYVRQPTAMSDMISEKSEYMRGRMSNSQFEVAKSIDELLLNPSKYEKLRDFAGKHGYFMQQGMQNLVDTVVWTGAYNQAMAADPDEKAAVRAADSAVRLTQGSFSPEDQSRFESGNAFVRAFTMFYSYFNMQSNLLGTEFTKIVREFGVKKGMGKLLYVYVLGFMIPAVLSEMIVQAAGGFDDGDDDEYDMFDAMSLFFGSQARALGAMAPVVGPAVTAGANMFNSKPYDDRISTSPSISAIEASVRAPASVYNAIVEDKSWKKAVRDTLTMLGMITGLPLGQLAKPAGYAADVAQGNANPESALDVVRGLVSGKDVNRKD